LRLLLIGLTIAMMLLGYAPGLFGAVSGFDLFVGIVGAILVLLFIKQTLTTAKRLALTERR
jgi:hypothetical protein